MPHISMLAVSALVAMTQFYAAVTSAAGSEAAPSIIATQLRRQGLVCTPQEVLRDVQRSVAHEVVWVERCNEASYRVRLIPHLGARVTPIECNGASQACCSIKRC
jgi:hypothetical protein